MRFHRLKCSIYFVFFIFFLSPLYTSLKRLKHLKVEKKYYKKVKHMCRIVISFKINSLFITTKWKTGLNENSWE